MSGNKLFRSLAAWLLACAMLVGVLASCDLSSLGLGGMVHVSDHIKDEDDDYNNGGNKKPSKDEESSKEEATKRPGGWFDKDDETARVEENTRVEEYTRVDGWETDVEKPGYDCGGSKHSIYYTYELDNNATSCTDGLIRTAHCNYCDYESVDVVYAHEGTEIVDGVGCGHMEIPLYTCTCGEVMSCGYVFGNHIRNYKKVVDGEGIEVSVYEAICDQCGDRIEMEEYYRQKGCENYCYIDLKVQGQTINTVKRDGDCHNTTCDKVEEECFLGYLDGEFVERFVYIEHCTNCGVDYVKYGDCRVYSDASRKELLRREEMNYEKNGSGEFVLTSKMVEEYKYFNSPVVNVQDAYYISARTHYMYDESGAEVFFSKDEYKYTGNGCDCVGIFSNSDGERYEYQMGDHHANFVDVFEMKNPGGSCLDGVEVVSLCTMCGYENWRDEWGKDHAFSESDPKTETIFFADHGHSCEYKISVLTCVCGEETQINLHFDAEHIRGYSQTINGIEHYFETYRCNGECGQYWTVESWNEKDAECNTNMYRKYTFDDGFSYTCFEKREGYHSTYAEPVANESTVIKNSDGSRVVVEVFAERCSDCGAYISKTVRRINYTKDNIETYREEFVYATNNGDLNDIRIVSEFKESYGVAQSNYDANMKRKYRISAISKSYDESGAVSDYYEEYYSYYDGNYCYATIVCKRPGCEDQQYNSEQHGSTVSQSALEPGAVNCLDGVHVRYFCSDCGQSQGEDHISGSHSMTASEKISFADLGGGCNTYLIVNRCLCGERTEFQFEGECYFEHVDGESRDFDNDGMTDIDKNMYRCSKCGFAYVEYHEYSVDSSCVQTVKHGFILGVDEIDGLGKENVSCIEVSEHLVHRLFEDQRLEGACLIIEAKCSVCDRTVATEERKNNTITRTNYLYYANGNLCDISIEENYVFYNNAYGEYRSVPKRTRYEHFSLDGSHVNLDEYTWNYSSSENECYCGHYYVIHKNASDPDGYICEEGDNHNWNRIYDNRDCVPGRTLLEEYCIHCGEERYSQDTGKNMHSFKYDGSIGRYVCLDCGIMADSDEYQRMVIADMTGKEFNGELNYVVGYVDHWGHDDWAWSLTLVLADGREYGLDNSYITSYESYRLIIDASAIASIAARYGAYNCNYLIKVEAHDINDGDTYCAYLNGHVQMPSADSSHVCEGEKHEIYDCALCGKSGVLDVGTYVGHNYRITETVKYSYDAEGNRTTRTERALYCVECGHYEVHTIIQKHTPWGECLEYNDGNH